MTQPPRHTGSPPAPLQALRPSRRALGRSVRAGVALALLAGGVPRRAHAADPPPPPPSPATGRPHLLLSQGVEVGRQPDGSVVLPNDQVLRPAGQQVEFVGRPNAVAVSPDGRTATFLTAGDSNGLNPGFQPFAVVNLATGAVAQQFDPGDANTSFNGIIYAPDGRHLYASLADGKILIADVSLTGTLSLDALVSLPSTNGDPYPGGLALSPDGKTLYVALSRDNALGVFNLAAQKLVAEIPVGNAPHSVVVDGDMAYVSDEGGRLATTGDYTNTSGGTAVVADPVTGGAATGAVSAVNLATRATVQTIMVGLHPTALTLRDGTLFVANTDGDSVSVVDTARNTVVKTIAIQPFPDAPFGSSPTALALLPDGRLVVSLAANNALAVYTYRGATRPVRVDGLLPTGWFPGALALDQARRRLVVANVRGVGDLGPLVTRTSPLTKRTGHYTHSYLGSASLIPYPTADDLARGTTGVERNNGWGHIDTTPGGRSTPPQAIPLHVGDPSTIKHVFYIIKENNTYDSILGDDPRGNGDPNLAEFGGDLSPNHHALARQFPLFDNLYVSGENSALGHQWTDQAYAPDYLEKAFSANNRFVRGYPSEGGDALAYLPSGFLWDDALRHGRTVHNYGEYANKVTGPQSQFGPWTAWYHDALILEGKAQGRLHVPLGTFQEHSDVPSNDALLNRDYLNYIGNLPDQYRVDIFLREFQQYVRDGGLPNLVLMALPNDHTSGFAPGYPTPRAIMADNDLALGRIVDAVSHSPYWKDSAIFVVEDDNQNDVDHVDGQRTVGFAISPYVRHGLVDHTYYTQIDMVRTIEQILGLPPMNQLDLAATPMYDAFADTPDLTPYNAVANIVPLDELNPTLVPSPSPTVPAAGTTTPTAGTPTSGRGGGGTATPELSSSALLGGGFIAAGLVLWRRRPNKRRTKAPTLREVVE